MREAVTAFMMRKSELYSEQCIYLQMCSLSLEWPPLASLVAKAQEPRGCLKRLSDTVRHVFNVANVTDPEDEGVIDHMVSITTAMRSPLIAVACHTVSNRALHPVLTLHCPLQLALHTSHHVHITCPSLKQAFLKCGPK